MKSHPHLRLVPDPEPHTNRGILSGPPWTWIGLATATLVVPVARMVSEALSAYERDEEIDDLDTEWSEVAENR